VNLSTADTITPPSDAWVDWDAKTQKFDTVADATASKTLISQFNTELQTASNAVSFTNFNFSALSNFLTNQGSQYATITGDTPDVASALANADTQTEVANEVNTIKGLGNNAAKRTELRT